MRFSLVSAALGGLLVFFLGGPIASAQQPVSKVFIDGAPTPVYFMDGDSYKVLDGPHKGANARLNGFNTLESYGGVHRWGSWNPKELYHNAKLATYNARRGIWHCFDMKELDTYGRMLMWCPDLAVDQVRRGYAHAYNATDELAKPELLAAQEDAIKHKRGMWAHGVPQYVMTSLHSISEVGSKDYAYNRLISTIDGHSAKWKHRDSYGECEWVCRQEHIVDESKIAEVTEQAKKELGATLTVEDYKLQMAIGDYARLGYLVGIDDEVQASALEALLTEYVKEGRFGALPEKEGSCVLFVVFERRYGKGRAVCLH